MRLAIVLLTLWVTGCVSQQEMAHRQALQAEQHRQAEIAYTNGLMNQCRSIGYQEGTEGFRQCVLQLHSQAQAQNAALRNIILQQYMQQQVQQRPAETHCRTDYVGGYRCTHR